MQDVVTRHHIMVKGFVSKEEPMHVTRFDLIVNLTHAMWSFKVTCIKEFKHLNLQVVDLFDIAITKNSFKNLKVLTK
jgi:hypothetical protein